jgi:hypothetical protein
MQVGAIELQRIIVRLVEVVIILEILPLGGILILTNRFLLGLIIVMGPEAILGREVTLQVVVLVVVALGAIAVAAAVDHHQVQVEALRAAVLQGQADQEDRLISIAWG